MWIKRRDGFWCVVDHNDKRISAQFETRQQALNWLDKLRDMQETGVWA